MDPAMNERIENMFTSFMEFQRERINWTVGKVMNANLHIVQYQPLQGSIYIPLPAKLANKKAIVNVQNQDHKFFMWLILASLHPKQGQDNNPNRVSNNTSYQGELHFMNIPSPVRVADDPKFEKKTIFPSISSDMKGRIFTRYILLKKVDLLVITSEEKTYYCRIKHFNQLLSDQNRDRNQYHYCY